MKKTNNKIYTFLVVTGLFFLAVSCLKDDRYVDFSKVSNIVEMLDGNPDAQSAFSKSIPYNALADDSVFVRVNVTGAYPLNKALTVTLDYDVAALQKYDTAAVHFNADNDSLIQLGSVSALPIYDLLPDSLYTLPSKTLVIPANKRANGLLVLCHSSKFDLSQSYVLPFKITDASGVTISGNFGNILINIAVANDYEADYAATGYVFHPSAPRALNQTKHVATINATTCENGVGDLGGPGARNFLFTVDKSTTPNPVGNWVPKDLTASGTQSGFFSAGADNPGGIDYSVAAPNTPGVTPWLSSDYNNTYDPVNKIFWLHYGYGGGASDQNGWSRNFYEKLTRK